MAKSSMRKMSKKQRSNGRRSSQNTNDSGAIANQRVSRFVPNVFGFPDKLQTTLRYHFLGAINSVSGATGKQVFRWNSVYDPDYTNAGHQPLYRDSFAAVYDQYAVVSARVTIRYTNPNTTTFLVGALTDDDSTSSTSTDTLCEQSHGMRALLTPLSGSRSEQTFKMTWTCKDVLGIDPYASELYKTGVGSDPTEVSTLILWAADVTGATNGILVDVMLEQDVLFTELATPTQS